MSIRNETHVFDKVYKCYVDYNYIFHTFICSYGLIGIIDLLSILAGRLFVNTQIAFNEWVLPFYHPEKQLTIYRYIFSVVFLFLYYIATYLISFRLRSNDFGKSTIHSISLFLVTVSINFLLFIFSSKLCYLGAVLLVIGWVVVFLYPFVFLWIKVVNRFYGQIVNIYFGLLLLILLQITTIFVPFIYGEIKIKNEYLDIPEVSILGDKFIDNDEYISTHNLFGNKNKYTIKNNIGAPPLYKAGYSFEIEKTSIIEKLIESNRTKFYYDDQQRKLYISGRILKDEVALLVFEAKDELHRKKIEKVFFLNDLEQNMLKKQSQTAEERNFLLINKYELEQNIYDSVLILHHHNHLLGPINEYSLGKEIKDIFMIYGWLPTLTIRALMEFFGGINYQTYFKVLFSFYPIYYILFVLTSFLLLQRIEYVLLSLILSFASINFWGFLPIFVAPGYVPFRHFFDVLIVMSFFLYLQRDRSIYLIISLVFSLLALLSDSNFGFFIWAALLMVIVMRFQQIKNVGWLFIVTALISGVCIKVLSKSGPDIMTSYFLRGLNGWPLERSTFLLLLSIIGLSYFVVFMGNVGRSKLRSIGLLLLLYSQGILIYWVLFTEKAHLFSIAPILILSGVVLLKIFIRTTARTYEKAVLALLILASIVLYVPCIIKYYMTKNNYDHIFETHKTYQWDFDRAKFKSTMDPSLFSDAVKLIKQYSDQNSIHIISKYDNILPFLSGKYSAMPFFEVAPYLLTDKEIRLCIERIQIDKPKYVFIDTDIERNLNSDVIDEDVQFLNYLHDRSIVRVKKLNLLKDIYQSIKNDYRPLQKGYLITVYERMPS